MATKTKEVKKAEKEQNSSDKPATDEEREELGAAKTGPLSDIGNMRPVDAPEEDSGPETEFVEDPSGKDLALGGKVESNAVLTNTEDDTYVQDRVQSVYTKPDSDKK